MSVVHELPPPPVIGVMSDFHPATAKIASEALHAGIVDEPIGSGNLKLRVSSPSLDDVDHVHPAPSHHRESSQVWMRTIEAHEERVPVLVLEWLTRATDGTHDEVCSLIEVSSRQVEFHATLLVQGDSST